MARPKAPDLTVRKKFAADIDEKLPAELKHLSADLGEPIYKLVEKALWTYVKRQKAFLKKRKTKNRT